MNLFKINAFLFLLSWQSFGMAGSDADYLAARSRLESSGMKVTESQVTGHARFVQIDSNSSLQAVALAAVGPEKQLQDFLAENGAVFGLRDYQAELELAPRTSSGVSGSHISMQQMHLGIPVYAAVLKAHFDRSDRLYAVNGTSFDDASITNRNWKLSSHQAEQVALRFANRFRRGAGSVPDDVAAQSSRQVWYHDGLLKGVPGQIHPAYEILLANPSGSRREWVIVDASKGQVLNRINGIHSALERKISQWRLPLVIWDESLGDPDPIPTTWPVDPVDPIDPEDPGPWQGSPQQLMDWQNELDGSRETYNLFRSMTNGTYPSYDGADATMRVINDLEEFVCGSDPNANWNGQSANFCPNVTGDDTVAHEWGHAYTEYTSNLIYQWQSGALNEAYSDIWGEVVDFLNFRGTDTPNTLRATGVCSSNPAGSNFPGAPVVNTVRWLSGENDPAFGGAIRDLWYPECFGDPGSVSSPVYWCSEGDSGGVHINSGVPNRAFALMVDGAAGLGITGLGIIKSAHIHWAAQNMLTAASNFSDQADALEASCQALIGIDLPELDPVAGSLGLSGAVVSAANCEQVGLVVAAVQLRTDPVQCNFQPLLQSPAPAQCAGLGAVESIFNENWESGTLPAGWTVGRRAVANQATFDTPNWLVVNDIPPHTNSLSAAFAADLNVGDCVADDESGVIWLRSPLIEIPLTAGVAHIAFDHSVATEAGWDGGNLKIIVNGAPGILVPAENYQFNAYNRTLQPAANDNTNPLAGEAAFSGTDGGALFGVWGQSQVNLQGLAEPGDTVQLQFEFGVDGCGGVIGWYLDDTAVYFCSEEYGPGCGDGVLQQGEQCDDANHANGDGCSASCAVESGYECTLPIPGSSINHVADPGFEAGPFGGTWAESSSIFGTPVCDQASCGIDWQAHSGTYWAWFGGIGGVEEIGSVAQDLVIPFDADSIEFWYEAPACDEPGDFLELRIDGNTEWRLDGLDDSCFAEPYQQKLVDISAYADGGPHSIEFYSEVNSSNISQPSSFFIDDVGVVVTIEASPSVCTSVEVPIFIDGFE